MKYFGARGVGDTHITEPAQRYVYFLHFWLFSGLLKEISSSTTSNTTRFRTGIKQHAKVEYCSARRGMHLSLNSSRDMCIPSIFLLVELSLAEWSYVSQLFNTTSNIQSRWIRRGKRTNVYINFADQEEVNSPETALRFKFCLESLLFCRLCCS